MGSHSITDIQRKGTARATGCAGTEKKYKKKITSIEKADGSNNNRVYRDTLWRTYVDAENVCHFFPKKFREFIEFISSMTKNYIIHEPVIFQISHGVIGSIIWIVAGIFMCKGQNWARILAFIRSGSTNFRMRDRVSIG